jgi:flagellar hook-length control protein FliK
LPSAVSPSPTLADTLEHSAAKSPAVGGPTLKFHDSMKPQSDSSAPAPVQAVSTKPQSQDGSSGSAGNDSNAKTEHASNTVSARTDDKGFVQTLDAAAANPAGGHSVAADPTAVAAAMPRAAAGQAQGANSGAQQAAASSADSRPAETLPAASQGAAVVNAAHITVQPVQTEIRIELQAESLGGVELRAHIAGDQIGASISVEHHDAQVALTTDLPSLHNALAEKNLRLESFTVSQGTFSSLSGGLGQEAGQRGFSQTQTPAKFAYLEQPETQQTRAETPAEWSGAARSGAGLSVVA